MTSGALQNAMMERTGAGRPVASAGRTISRRAIRWP